MEPSLPQSAAAPARPGLAPGAPSAAELRKAGGQLSLFQVGIGVGPAAVGKCSVLQLHAQTPELRAALAARAAAEAKELASKADRFEQERAAAAEGPFAARVSRCTSTSPRWQRR